ncbi:eukaryotic translation initiation factor 2D isoform X2 [Tripterygium wilfordii]|uniref:Eukaryotic translation initiation factor 2D isoform X2 n=1 Tax=Tripterygium wilfordii TaxID=458696 RepID=A0A7J7CXI8_TRIWF|nr:eukaryotic translation initiation factor 2D isoform X2 [Tripterygium wilfordii]
MFKKAVEAKSHQRLSGADRKKLKRTIRERFRRASDADIDALLPPKAEITVSKFQNRVHVYGVEGGFPMFFDIDGRRTEIFPTGKLMSPCCIKKSEGSLVKSNHVLPCRPSGITLDVKKSSHKKLSKWLQAKSSVGLISVKEDKYKKEVVLFSINRNHPDYMSFKPEKRRVEKNDQAGDHASSGGLLYKMLEVAEIYKPSVHVNPIFASVGADTGKLYSASEASEIVFEYIEKGNLVKPTNKSVVVLDPTLCDALFKGAIKKGSTYPTEIHKKDLGPTFISRMQAHHIVTRGNESAVRKGSLKALQIVTERRQGNKKVTKVSGVETFLIDAEALATELQKKFACSTTVAELPGKKGLEVLIQGGVIEEVGKYLIEQYGIPKRYIEVLDKTKK